MIVPKASVAEYIDPFAAAGGAMTLLQVLAEVVWGEKRYFRITLAKSMGVKEMLEEASFRWRAL
jgi:hypothetical protein